MKKPIEEPEWVKSLRSAVASGRVIQARIDNDCVLIDDVTDVPPREDIRWEDDDFNPYVEMFPDEDLDPRDVMVGLFAALGVKAAGI